MPLLTQSISSFLGGVSQQSPHLRADNQCEEMVNAFPSMTEGLVKRQPSSIVAAIRDASTNIYSGITASSAKCHLIVRDATEKYFVFIKPAASAANCAIEVYGLDGTKKTVYYGTGAQDYLVNATKDSLKALTVADVTFVVNSGKTVNLDSAITTAVDANRSALVFIKQTSADRNYKIVVSNMDGTGVITATHKVASNNAGTNHVAAQLAAGISGLGSPTYTATAKDSVIHITRGQDFLINVEDDIGGQGMVLIRHEVQRFEDLPSSAPNDYIVKVTGAPESGVDDYYVKFVAEGGQTFARGLWQETIAPGLKYQYDFATTPHILIRQSNGTFLFKKADGTTPGSNVPAGANYNAYKWTNRLVGDDVTNDFPSFVGFTVSNLVLFKNRLGFLSEENVVLSEVSEFFNFWRTTVLDLPDSDPIDIASSSPKIGKLKSGTVFNAELILFTDSSQLALRGGEILSSRSVALLPVGDYENYSDIQPISSGLSIYFAYNRGNGFTGLREMVPQQNISGSYVVNTVSELVPSYIVGKPDHITASAQENMAALVSNGELYLYKYAVSDGSVIQSAWFKYNFPDTASGGLGKVLWAEFVDMELYVLVSRTGSQIPVLEKIRLGNDVTDSGLVLGANWTAHLDQRELKAAGTGSYNVSTGLTTWNLAKPYSYAAGKSAVYTTSGSRLPVLSGTTYNISSDAAGTLSVRGDYSNVAVWIGMIYEMKYQFSQFWLQGRSGVRGQSSLLNGRYQLKNLSLSYEDTSYFKVKVATDGENNYEYEFSGLVVGTSVLNQIYLNRGSFRLPIYGRNTSTTVTIVNDTALPCKLLSGEIEAEYTDRATRFA
jgi:hypothetical protein